MSARESLGIARSLAIYYGQPWKLRRMRRLAAQWLRPGSLAFDVGSHVGNRIGVWRALGARVVAFEPQPACARFLSWRYGNQPGVTLLPVAVGDLPGEAVMAVSRRTPTVSTLARDWIADVRADVRFDAHQWDHEVKVPVVTLDQMIERYGRPDFCKIDVEGFELRVLEGLSRALPVLSFEFIPVTTHRALACVDRLQQLGTYEYNVSLRETQRLCFDTWRSAADIRTWLTSRPLHSASGDVYARSKIPT